MPGNRPGNLSVRIPVPIVIPAVANELAAAILEQTHEIGPLHVSDSSATRLIPGISPLVRSLNRSFS